MRQLLPLLLTMIGLLQALPQQDIQTNENPKPLFFILERSPSDNQAASQQQKEKVSARQQEGFEPQNGQFAGFPFLETQFQYGGYNQQGFPRVQPSIFLYGAGGQGQPILINPGSPPGNFLVPQPQPGGPNVVYRGNPQQRPFFVSGYPNPKPAHIPPIEKDAEEIPTNPAKIPPLASSPTTHKPEKLETFTEGKTDYPLKPSAGEADVLATADKNPQFINTNALRPGQRFFFLNGDNLFANYPSYQEDRDVQQVDNEFRQSQVLQKQPERPIDFNNIPVHTLLLRGRIPNPESNQEQSYPFIASQQFPQNLVPFNNQPVNGQEAAAFFRSGAALGADPIGQFRFNPPSDPYYPFRGEDVDDDSIVVEANFEDALKGGGAASDSQTEEGPRPEASGEPGTAQAAPGAIALAGPGGMAGASPRATSIVGKGGLAVSNPQATAVAGANKNEGKEDNKKRPIEKSNK